MRNLLKTSYVFGLWQIILGLTNWFFKFLSIYLSSRLEAKAEVWGQAKIRAKKIVDVGKGILLSLVEALLVNSSLSSNKKL